MACDSSTSIPINEGSDSSTWSSDTENQKINNPKTIITKLPPTEEKKIGDQKNPKKKKKIVSVCLTHCRYDVIRKIAQKFAYKEVAEGENWNLYWTDLSITVERCKDMKRFQKINHFPGMLEICRKDLLARNLTRMQRLYPRDYNFFPKTWCFPADLGDAITYSRIRRNKTFILKPDAGSQGRGIIITKSLKDIRPCDRGICQVYISRPFLIDGYKFDLRVYALITSCDPLRVYVYNEGLVRFATSQYKEPNGVNITNVFMHLTNYAVNKHSRTYNQDIGGNGSKRKLTWFNNYLKSLKYDINAIWYRIDDVIVKTIISAYPVLKHSYAACFPNHDVIPACCELLGIDIILDRKMNPLILEVNHSPSFHTDTPLDCEVKEGLLSDMFAMMSLEKCDKRRIMREDRKRIRERLLHGNKEKDYQPIDIKNSFTEYFKNEYSNKGNFRLVYPGPNCEQVYRKYFDQGQNTLYSDTVSSRAREAAQNAFRGEMVLRQKLEASKRVAPLVKTESNQNSTSSRSVSKQRKVSGPLASFNQGTQNLRNSFQPQQIVESEEKERLKKLAQRDYLLRSHGILEHVYFSLKKNKVLRPEDDRKYAIFEKMRSAAQVINHQPPTGPIISDMLEGIQPFEYKGAGEMIELKKDLVKEFALLNNSHKVDSMYTELDKSGTANLKFSKYNSILKM
ncbi:tubulin polyglutamylase ttll6-like [Anthonomus grandis grandis]|uniref:tubulin polyglutamylase ttll6-like n=1 Tax=Anthonomus grandis grandis TaxID=2921223 RepID=UPI00216552D0|nr:tubulin polyglutamylase ttll6-like [Anthonomus grandis grandis]